MSAQEKSEVLARVEETWWGKRKLLAQLQVPRSTYYRWRARERAAQLVFDVFIPDDKPF